ncbi:UDP-N-acetyl-D-glucosamine dehydrogenase [Listeria ivanovii]|uniref:nucleotide sugar dehydrogenase n=1 Tax=Listeria ivanovii TaxID=1638 RepID=UPI000DA6DF44|nr:nucleotide sugar dehydrogenase [Listeria ivanovii]PZF90518.1 UDP-N-acetyl-D-glucosamine dehydrogenase [Listeria ivanovii]PZG06154.1 UDP-N-acetyl-D-glucosamine dehydrogenase [Listeria ivanovii]PZG29835.1 UDP-N-acetyl-D-glucosamine dehydrogenase [Listeria ivanovii]PZG86482.1 UDP-N-acetyl-D-glucosamine dehydrogenase [Listeria ivanovii]
MYYEAMQEKIKTKNYKVGIIGLGYVGLPLAIEFAEVGYNVIGFDIHEGKTAQLMQGNSYIIDIPNLKLQTVIENGFFMPTTDFSKLSEIDAVCICVPTPLTKSQEPDMSYIIAAVTEIKRYLKPGMLITLESTTYPGTTEELIQAEIEALGYHVGEGFFLCFSPERVDPGNKTFQTKNTPKVLGGTTSNCCNLGEALYSKVIDNVYLVSSTKVAEMTKLLENTFRSINIAFINEMAMLCEALNINVWEVIDAAGTKPFGFMKFTPGPGIGGHCIPLDPMYLSWKAKGANFFSRFIELAQETNKKMPEQVIHKVVQALNTDYKSIRGSKVLVLGMAYKPNIDDVRESPALEVYELLRKKGATLTYYDPYVTAFYSEDGSLISSETSVCYSEYDVVVVLTNHHMFDAAEILSQAKLIVDTRNMFKGENSEKVFRIGAGIPECHAMMQ